MKITYAVDEAQFLRAHERFWSAHKQASKLAHIAGLTAVAFGTFVFATYPGIYFLSGSLIIIGALLALFPFLRRRLYRSAYHRNRKFKGEIKTDFREDGISSISERGPSDFDWDVYRQAFETDDAFLLLFSKQLFSIIPKEAFAHTAEMDEFRALATEKIGDIREI